MHETTRVLIVDDSPLFTDALSEILARHPRITVVGVARDGVEALELVGRLEPDVVTMDIHMPKMDGLEAVERIMAKHPTPIMVLTADENSRDQNWCFEALRRGALELSPKPDLDAIFEESGMEFCERVRLLSCVPVIHHFRRRTVVPSMQPAMPAPPAHIPAVVGMVASTGGPSALAEVLGSLPPNFPLPVLVVQHLAAGFEPHLARWLRDFCALEVRTATEHAALEPGVVLLAPEGRHLKLGGQGWVKLAHDTGEAHCPSGDLLLASIAAVFHERSIGIVMTGMGKDGARGLKKMQRVGALTIAQSAESSVVDGMPRAARECGAANESLSLTQISTMLLYRAREFTLEARRPSA